MIDIFDLHDDPCFLHIEGLECHAVGITSAAWGQMLLVDPVVITFTVILVLCDRMFEIKHEKWYSVIAKDV